MPTVRRPSSPAPEGNPVSGMQPQSLSEVTPSISEMREDPEHLFCLSHVTSGCPEPWAGTQTDLQRNQGPTMDQQEHWASRFNFGYFSCHSVGGGLNQASGSRSLGRWNSAWHMERAQCRELSPLGQPGCLTVTRKRAIYPTLTMGQAPCKYATVLPD